MHFYLDFGDEGSQEGEGKMETHLVTLMLRCIVFRIAVSSWIESITPFRTPHFFLRGIRDSVHDG
ncbi:hypothetical protein E2C01_049615 [Portunus trituberculatus]|uniref:Uncharacterized protein n=1 Tax=Portunus trituberculatus TaxID=210409 RepID=A0A5B7G9Y3_PORTR|nr:hypothetical protein [Portunus trituberculatus]